MHLCPPCPYMCVHRIKLYSWLYTRVIAKPRRPLLRCEQALYVHILTPWGMGCHLKSHIFTWQIWFVCSPVLSATRADFTLEHCLYFFSSLFLLSLCNLSLLPICSILSLPPYLSLSVSVSLFSSSSFFLSALPTFMPTCVPVLEEAYQISDVFFQCSPSSVWVRISHWAWHESTCLDWLAREF